MSETTSAPEAPSARNRSKATTIPATVDPMASEAVVKLAFPIKVAGTLTSELTVRRPKLKDRLNVSLSTEMTADQQEALIIANTAGLSLDELEQLDLSDFNRVQGVFQVFLSARPS